MKHCLAAIEFDDEHEQALSKGAPPDDRTEQLPRI